MNRRLCSKMQLAAFSLAIAAVFLLVAGGLAQATTSCNLKLPSDAATMVVDVNEYKACGTLSSFQSLFFAALSGLPASGFDITNGTYNGSCADLFGTVLDNPMYGGAVYTVYFYSSTDPLLPNALKMAGTDLIPWDKINYILKTYPNASWLDMQAAVWSLVHGCNLGSQASGAPLFYCTPDRPSSWGPFPYGPDNQGCTNAVNIGNVQIMVADANTNGGGYTPGPGDPVAVVVDITNCTGSSYCDDPRYLPFQIIYIPLTCCSGSIGDFVWHDLNRNGIQDAGEPGIDGVTVNLKNSTGTVIATTITGPGPLNQHGYYQFIGLCAGNYKVEVDETTLPLYFTQTTCDNTPGVGDNSNCSPSPVTLLTDNSTDQTIDFGYVSPCTGSIGDYVWHDVNRNGIQDNGDAGINGVTVNLLDISGPVLATTTTGNGPDGTAGYYQFNGLCAGDYTVEVVTPAGFSPTVSGAPGSTPANDSNGSPAPVTLPTDNSSDQTIDFGFVTPCTGSIGDFVWHDQNRNGIQDLNEPGIDGVKVELQDSAGSIIATTTTAVGPLGQHGYYQFTGLCAGQYNVLAATPAGFSPTTSNVGSDRTADSNGSPAPVTLSTDYSDQTIDFGYVTPCTGAIGDFVWEDLNGNGLFDSGEPVLPVPVTVNLRRASDFTIIATTATDGTGFYQFTGLCAGDYKVEVVPPPGYQNTPTCFTGQNTDNDSNCSPALVNLPQDFVNNTIDFGLIRPASLGDLVWDDKNFNGQQDAGEPGLPGVTVTLFNCDDTPAKDIFGNPVAPQTTDASGNYLFTNLPPGSYYVVFSNLPAGYVFTLQNSGSDVTDSDANRTTGKSEPCVTLASGDTNLTVDAGLFNPMPAIDLVKKTNGTDNNSPTGPNVPVGSTVTWTYIVTNTGNVDLSNVVVTDDNGTPANPADDFTVCTIPTLAAGTNQTCTKTGIAILGQYANMGYVTGQYNGTTVTDNDPDHYYGVKAGCVRSPGYWKNHPEAWPVDRITIGGKEYTKDEAIAIMDKPVAGDKTYTMFDALVAAKLNVAAGADASCIAGTIAAAEAWMTTYPVGSGVKADSDAWKIGEPLYMTLDKYNNGYLCSPYCGDQPPQPTYPKIDIEKYTNGYDADVAPGPYIWVNEKVTWTYMVKNTGTTTLTSIKVTDDKIGTITCPKSSLMPGESMTCTKTGTAVYGQYENTGCVVGYSNSVKVTDCDMSHYYGQKGQMGCGTGTPGYWKNHPRAWPAESITIGGVKYTKDQAIAIMNNPVAGDKTYTMFDALVAAKLNVMVGTNSSCIADTITAAEKWFMNYKLGSGVSGSSDAWKEGEPLYWRLDYYNNGLLCAPHRDSLTNQCSTSVPSESLLTTPTDSGGGGGKKK